MNLVSACNDDDYQRHHQFLFVAQEQRRGANIGTSLRCAVAFRVDAFVLIGSGKFSTHGAHGDYSYLLAIVTFAHIYMLTNTYEFVSRL